MESISTYFYLLCFFFVYIECCLTELPKTGALARENDTRNRLAFSPPTESHKGQPCRYPTIMIGLVVVFFHVSFLVCLFVSKDQPAEMKTLGETVQCERSESDLSLIYSFNFLSF